MRRRWMLLTAGAALVAALAVGGVVWLAKRKPAQQVGAGQVRPDRRLREQDGRPCLRRHARDGLQHRARGRLVHHSFRRDAARKVAASLQPDATGLPENVARLVAAREGVGVVTSGSVAPEDRVQGDGPRRRRDDRKADRLGGGQRGRQERRPRSRREGWRPGSGAPSATRRPNRRGSRPRRRSPPARSRRRTSTRSRRTFSGRESGTTRSGTTSGRRAGREHGTRVRGARGGREQPRPPGRGREQLQAGARADRPDERPREVPDPRGYYILARKADSAIEEFSALVKQFPADTAGSRTWPPPTT